MNQTQQRNLFLLLILIISLSLLQFVNNSFSKSSDKPNLPTPTPTSTPTPSPSSSISYKTFAEVPNVPPGKFKFGNSTTWAPIQKTVHPEIQKARPEFQLEYTPPPSGETPGSNTGIRMLLNNQLDFSVSSRPLKPDEKNQGLEEIPVAIDAIAIAVNHQLNVKGLTVEQLKAIYTGKITNWSDIIGGQNLEIKPYTRHPDDGGTVDYFFNDVLNIRREELGPNVAFAEDTTNGIRKVKDNRGGIYYASAPEVVGQCSIKPLPLGRTSDKFVSPNEPLSFSPNECTRFQDKFNKVNAEAFRNDDYPITRKLFVIVKQNDPIKQQAGKAYANLLITQQGQQLLEQVGYVSFYGTTTN